MSAFGAIGEFSRKVVGRVVDPHWFPGLRQAQRQAFQLPQYDFSFLLGPPGTGKTSTLGMLMASFLTQFPISRVLLLSTTNVAVDEALVAVDQALQEIPSGESLRRLCQRIGSHFVASRYSDRRHLLPKVEDVVLQA